MGRGNRPRGIKSYHRPRPRNAREQTALYNKYRGRQKSQRRYFEWFNATRRGISYYNKFRQPYTTYRYREIWPQRTVQRTVPRFTSPNVSSGTALGPLSSPSQGGAPSVANPLSRWSAPSLGYEQQNRDWTIHKPWTQSMNKPPIPQFQEAQRRLSQTRSDYLYTTIPYSHMPPEIGDVAWVNTQQPRQRPKQWPRWEPLTRPFLPDRPWAPDNPPEQPPEQPPENSYKPQKPCWHWDARLQTTVPCSQKKKSFISPLQKNTNQLAQYQHRSTHFGRQQYRSHSNSNSFRFPGSYSRRLFRHTSPMRKRFTYYQNRSQIRRRRQWNRY